MSPYICAFYLFYVHAFTKSSPAGRIEVCLTARKKFTGVPAETAGEISFEEIHSRREMGSRVALKVRTIRLVPICTVLSSQLLPLLPNLIGRFSVKENRNEEIKDTKGWIAISKENVRRSRSYKE